MSTSQLEQVPCPLCANEGEFLALTVPDGDENIANYGSIYAGVTKSRWVACGKCGFVHQNPRPSLQALNEFYAQSRYHSALNYNRRRLDAQFKTAYAADLDFVSRHVPSHVKSVFDVGCGLGYALAKLRDRGWAAAGIEPDEGRHKYATEQLGLTNVQRGIMSRQIVPTMQVDMVYSHHAFEHVADLDDVMDGIKKVLNPGGYFFCAVPTYYRNRSNMSKLYLNSGHYSSFTHKSLMQLLSRHGFEYVVHEYFNDYGNDVTDDLLLLAKFTGKNSDAASYYEDPRAVQRYVNVVNPLRSIVFSPVYAVAYQRLSRRLMVPHLQLIFRDPGEFLPLVVDRLRGRRST